MMGLHTKFEDERKEAKESLERLRIDRRISSLSRYIDLHLTALYTNSMQMQSIKLNADQPLMRFDEYIEDLAWKNEGLLSIAILEQENWRAISGYTSDKDAITAKGYSDGLRYRIAYLAESLGRRASFLELRGIDATDYHQALISATGQLSGNIFDPDVAAEFIDELIDGVVEWYHKHSEAMLWSLFMFVLIAFLSYELARVIAGFARFCLNRSKLRISNLAKDFIVFMTKSVIFLIGILIALAQLGVEVTPLLAGLGVMGIIVGLSLQDSLGNFASGMMILFSRPYEVGDLVEVGSVRGYVSKMSLVSTTVHTTDNQSLVIPNSKIWGDVIRNVGVRDNRRVDLEFSIGYGDDIAKAEAILQDIVANTDLALDDPEPNIKLHRLGESSVDFIVRPWVYSGDYWEVYWDITRRVKERFDAEGVTIPFPQRDVHVYHSATPIQGAMKAMDPMSDPSSSPQGALADYSDAADDQEDESLA